jgi:DNA-directed RNA polymerase specialized sigma24 family protein
VLCKNDAQTPPKVRELSAKLGHPSNVSGAAVPDAELGVLARSGDVQGLAAMLELCRPSLYATAMGLLGNRADALDAVQETCVVALRRFGDVRDVAAARGWLHRVLRNVCLMRLRQRRDCRAS